MKKILIIFVMLGFFITPVWADEAIIEKAEEIKANVILPIKLEGLEWKLKYYQEKTVNLQLRAMVQVWNQVEFQDLQRTIRQTDQEIKRLLILK